MNKSQLMLLKVVATFLMVKNGSTTTLEIKEELRRRFPKGDWRQDEVSDAMIALETELDTLTFEDTGTFRIYKMKSDMDLMQAKTGKTVNVVNSIPSSQVATKPKKAKVPKTASTMGVSKKLSRTDVVDLMKESKGKFYTVTFIKTDGSERTMNGQTKKSNFMDNLGYINFRESNGNIRRVNPKTIKSISISGNVYQVK